MPSNPQIHRVCVTWQPFSAFFNCIVFLKHTQKNLLHVIFIIICIVKVPIKGILFKQDQILYEQVMRWSALVCVWVKHVMTVACGSKADKGEGKRGTTCKREPAEWCLEHTGLEHCVHVCGQLRTLGGLWRMKHLRQDTTAEIFHALVNFGLFCLCNFFQYVENLNMLNPICKNIE